MERWPLSILPQVDETLASIFARLAKRYGLTTTQLLTALLRFEEVDCSSYVPSLVKVLHREGGVELDFLLLKAQQPGCCLGVGEAFIYCDKCWSEDVRYGVEPYGRTDWFERDASMCAAHHNPLSKCYGTPSIELYQELLAMHRKWNARVLESGLADLFVKITLLDQFVRSWGGLGQLLSETDLSISKVSSPINYHLHHAVNKIFRLTSDGVNRSDFAYTVRYMARLTGFFSYPSVTRCRRQGLVCETKSSHEDWLRWCHLLVACYVWSLGKLYLENMFDDNYRPCEEWGSDPLECLIMAPKLAQSAYFRYLDRSVFCDGSFDELLFPPLFQKWSF